MSYGYGQVQASRESLALALGAWGLPVHAEMIHQGVGPVSVNIGVAVERTPQPLWCCGWLLPKRRLRLSDL